ncbi:VanZ family protein [Lapidilactobacillus bayanensis]|uniref:VanZ family protein n=1 Tax=Lapidilactobacillus bayanensis TaxID=2485998 RepID=UPI0013DDECC8|nr:VanZ family protein [Lapidilactobacillus bayanensis]
MSHKWKKIYFCLAILIMILIFISSSMTYQQQTVTPELGHLNLNWLHRWLDPVEINYGGRIYSVKTVGFTEMIEFILRKIAHFSSNFLLGLFAYWGLTNWVPNKWFRAILIWLSCTGYAATDEFHQLLTGDRTPMIQDVMLDSIGVLCGVILASIIVRILERRAEKKQHHYSVPKSR